jgi:integrase
VFAETPVDAITIEDIDRYARRKADGSRTVEKRREELRRVIAQRETTGRTAEAQQRELRALPPALSNASINKTLDVLSAVLEQAVEYRHLSRNPAKGKRRRLPVNRPSRSWLDRADHIAALLDAAGELDQRALARHGQRRVLLATLAFAGLRIGELLALKWRDVELARGTITVRDSKTAAGVRQVYILPALRDELVAYRARLGTVAPRPLVFGTSTGGRQSETNVRRRVLGRAVEIANARLEEDGEPLPKLTPTRCVVRSRRSSSRSVRTPPT